VAGRGGGGDVCGPPAWCHLVWLARAGGGRRDRLGDRRVVMRSRNYAGALVAVALVTPLVARGAPDASGSDQYSAAITPTAVQPSQSALYEIDLKSHPRAPDSANEAEIDIPDGFSIDTSPIAITSCSATVWDATVDTAASRIVATSAPGAELCPGGTLSVSFSSTGPAGADVYLWTTRLTG